jgi:hypothetical protein
MHVWPRRDPPQRLAQGGALLAGDAGEPVHQRRRSGVEVVRRGQGRLRVVAQDLGDGVARRHAVPQPQGRRHQAQQQEVARARRDVEKGMRPLDVEQHAQVSEVAHHRDAAAGVPLEAQARLPHPGGGEVEERRRPGARRRGAGEAHRVEAARVQQDGGAGGRGLGVHAPRLRAAG